jgi:SAM-dependent methyltransferase
VAVTYSNVGWYETPQLYDIIYDTMTEEEADFLAAIYERFCPGKKRRVLEPACGSGRLLEAMARRGFEVSGFDLEPEMVRYARQRLRDAGYEAEVKGGRMESFRVARKAELAFCTVSTFRYLLTERDARSHLRCVANALRVGGIYVLGFHLSDYTDTLPDSERWRGRRKGTRVTCTVRSSPPDRARRREKLVSRLVAHIDGQPFRSETRWEFRTYNVPEFQRLLAGVPAFELVASYDFDHDIDRPRKLGRGRLDVIAVLQKRKKTKK